jgi:hypothetical protein
MCECGSGSRGGGAMKQIEESQAIRHARGELAVVKVLGYYWGRCSGPSASCAAIQQPAK